LFAYFDHDVNDASQMPLTRCDRRHIMDRSFPLWIAVALIISMPALAQNAGQPQQRAPNFQTMTPQDAARLNAAVSGSDDATKKQFGDVEQRLREANHPSAKMMEATRPQ
jgi:hypothetical protein